MDVANYILCQKSSQPETAPKVEKSWTTRFIKRHNYNKAHQKTLDSRREASEDLDRVNEYFNKLDAITRDQIITLNVRNLCEIVFC